MKLALNILVELIRKEKKLAGKMVLALLDVLFIIIYFLNKK